MVGSEASFDEGVLAPGRALKSILSTIEAELKPLNDSLKSCKSLGTSKIVFSDRVSFARRNPERWLISISRLISYLNTFQLFLQSRALADLQHPASIQGQQTSSATRFSLGRECVPLARLVTYQHRPRDRAGVTDLSTDAAFFCFGERYVDGPFRQQIFISAMLRPAINGRLVRYFVTYAATPRCWQRIILDVDFSKVAESYDIPQLHAVDSSVRVSLQMPEALSRLLKMLLPQLTLLHSVNKVCLCLREAGSAELMLESYLQSVSANNSVASMAYEDEALRQIQDMNCTAYRESDVAVLQIQRAHTYDVVVDSKRCILRRVPFAKAVGEAAYGLQDFYRELKIHIDCRACSGVAPFLGVVLDDTGRSLKGYLLEFARTGHMPSIFENAISRHETIPLSIREGWARQILEAVIEVHRRGLVVGNIHQRTFEIDTEGRAKLIKFTTSSRETQNQYGRMPPEWRDSRAENARGRQDSFDTYTDIFQLGLILWEVVEHIASPIGSTCNRYACTSPRRYDCSAHGNPVALPPCHYAVSKCWGDLIAECRSHTPHGRPTIERMREVLCHEIAVELPPAQIKQILHLYKQDEAPLHSIWCDACGSLTFDSHYHCYVCWDSDFDLCRCCVLRGVHCSDREHRLVERKRRHGVWVQA